METFKITTRICVVLFGLLPLALFAQQEPAQEDVASCLSCHAGRTQQGELPLIEGQQHDYLAQQLRRFAHRHRDSFPMSQFAQGMDDNQVEVLSAKLAALAWRKTKFRADADAVLRGQAIILEKKCTDCHGAAYQGHGVMPRLAGQNPYYLARQLRDMRNAIRIHPPAADGVLMWQFSDQQAKDIAWFLAVQKVEKPAKP